MTAHKRTPGPNPLAALDGAEIPGGCDYCNSVQRVQAYAGGSGVRITVMHDDWCPWWAARQQPERNTP